MNLTTEKNINQNNNNMDRINNWYQNNVNNMN